MRRRINNLISVCYTFVHLLILKIINGSNLKFSLIERISPNVVIELNYGGKLIIGQKIRVHSGSKIKVRKGAILEIDSETKLNYNCMIICHDSIKIGRSVEFGPNVLVYDHDHDFRADGGLRSNKYCTDPVEIGENSWIGANTIILRGARIGKNCIVSAGSVINGTFPDNTIIIQKRADTLINYK